MLHTPHRDRFQIAGASAVTEAEASAEHVGLPMPRRIWAIAAISFGTSLFVIDGAIANVALPTIARDLAVSNGVVTNVVTVYQLVLVMLLLPFSSVGDRIGHRTLYQAGQIVFLLASLATLLVYNFTSLLIVRALQALGAGMALSVSAAMLREIYPAKKLGSGMGINSVIVASSSALAPTLGGYIVAQLHWSWVFLAAAPFAALSLILGRSLPDPVRKDHKSEWVSGVWSAVTFLLLIGGLQIATHGSDWIYGLPIIVVGALCAFLLVVREKQRANPVFPVDLLAQPVLGLSALGAISAFIASGSLMLSLPFQLETVMGYSPDEVGLLLLPFPLTMLVVAPAAGWLSDRVAPTKLGITGMGLAILALLFIAFIPNAPGEFAIVWRLSLCALGFGLFFAPNSRLLIGRAPRHRAAAAGGLLSTARLAGQALAAAEVGILFAHGAGFGPLPMALSCAFAVIAALCCLARFRSVRASGGLTIGKRSADQPVDAVI